MFQLRILLTILLFCSIVSPCISSSRLRDSWASIEVLSFNGENILFNLKIFAVGNHADERMLVRDVPVVDGGVEVWYDVGDVVYHEGMNVTVFSYSYAYPYTNYEADPKIFGYLLFPWDIHTLVLFIDPQFDLTMDPKPFICILPTNNYEGNFILTRIPTNQHPFLYRLDLEIRHSSSFVSAVGGMLFTTISATYALSILLTIIIALIVLKKKSNDLIPNLIRISSAMIFFVPAFEIAFYNLKAPLPLVFSDVLMIPVIPWNIGIMISAVLLNYLALACLEIN